MRPDPSQPPDAGTTRVLEPFLRAYRPVAEKVLAVTEQPLRLPEKGDSTAPICRLGAEAMRDATGADAALFSVSALPEIGIPAEVTNAELFRLLPYENELCTVELTGEEFARLVKEIGAASRRGAACSVFPETIWNAAPKTAGTFRRLRKNSRSP